MTVFILYNLEIFGGSCRLLEKRQTSKRALEAAHYCNLLLTSGHNLVWLTTSPGRRPVSALTCFANVQYGGSELGTRTGYACSLSARLSASIDIYTNQS
jgi:hypothetical protein